MASLRDIRTRIGSVQNTQQITRAMKMVAAAKLRKAQERIFTTRPYAFKIREMIGHLRQRLDPLALFEAREEVGGVLLIVVTSDRGLAGAFNSNLLKVVEARIAEAYADLPKENLHVLAVGRKGHEYFANRGYDLVGDFRGAFNDLRFPIAGEVMDIAIEGFQEGRWDLVEVVYNEFKNTISQNRVAEQLLPIPSETFFTPVMEDAEDVATETADADEVEYIFEPSAEVLLERLVPEYWSPTRVSRARGWSRWRTRRPTRASFSRTSASPTTAPARPPSRRRSSRSRPVPRRCGRPRAADPAPLAILFEATGCRPGGLVSFEGGPSDSVTATASGYGARSNRP